jgi:hypothetical protein
MIYWTINEAEHEALGEYITIYEGDPDSNYIATILCPSGVTEREIALAVRVVKALRREEVEGC